MIRTADRELFVSAPIGCLYRRLKLDSTSFYSVGGYINDIISSSPLLCGY